jgi:hypothetical protein
VDDHVRSTGGNKLSLSIETIGDKVHRGTASGNDPTFNYLR